jgi:hypothetical protein
MKSAGEGMRLWTLAGAVLFTINFAFADAPRTLQYSGEELSATRDKYGAGDPTIASAVKDLIGDADKALTGPVFSVVNKPFTPPSGDKHDYMSLSPYWWPDPKKPDGKPYIRKDGQTNPERLKYDQPTLDAFGEAVEKLALAYFFTGDEKYAARDAVLLRAWYFDDTTKMNPNCRYSQFRPGYDEPQASGTLECNRMRKVVDADALLNGSSNWTKDDHEKLQAWFKEFLNYMMTSEQGHNEHNAPNNHGTWFAVQACTYAMFIGDDAAAKKLIEEQGKKRIEKQIEPDGKQPFEMVRTKAYDYCRFNLEALENLAMFAQRMNIDLWNYKTADGRSLRAAVDWLAPYASGEKQWDGMQITEPKMVETVRVYRFAAKGFQDQKYEDVVAGARKRGNLKPGDLTDLLYPPFK